MKRRRSFRDLLPWRSSEREVDAELRFHIEGRMRELLDRGWDAESARLEAMRRFGDYDAVREICHQYARQRLGREGRMMRLEGLWQDLRLALRGLARRPGFTATVVGTLALALGAGSAVFSVVNGVLLQPLPYPESDRLVRIFQQNSPGNRWTLSVVDFEAVRERQRTFESVAGAVPLELALSGDEGADWIRGALVTADFFRTLRVPLAQGRGFRRPEENPESAPAVVVGPGFRDRHFGPGVDPLGGSLVLNGRPHEVVGVLPAGVTELAGIRAEVWPVLQLEDPSRRGPFFIRAVGRLRDDASTDAARADLARISREVFPRWSDSFQDETATLTPYSLREVMVGDVRTILLFLLAAVGLVLLIALSNVANLVLSRAQARRREIAVREALGAGRARLARMLLVESLVLTGAGAIAGLLLAVAGIELLGGIVATLPRAHAIGIDGRVLGATGLVTLAAGALLALVPLWLGPGGGDALRSGTRDASGRRARSFRGTLVVAEFALALPVLAAAGLLLGTLTNLQSVDPGFDADGVVAVRLVLPPARYPQPPDRQAFWDEAVRRIDGLPGVDAAALATGLPPDAPGSFNNFDLVDRPVAAGARQPVSPWSYVTPGFFDALGLRVREGRGFRAGDDAAAPPVALVSRDWAERFYPGESAIGKAMVGGGCVRCPPITVVGVVDDVKYMGLDGTGEGVYTPLRQEAPGRAFLLLRVPTGPASVLPAVRRELRALDPALPLGDVTTLEQRLHASIAAPRHWATLLGAFALAAALLAGVGVFGVLSYLVGRERREIGVRMALGADARGVVRMVVGRGMARVAVGLAVGFAGALLVGRLLESQLYGVTPGDPRTLAAVTAALLLVALAACWIPARRAARIDPVRAIAAE